MKGHILLKCLKMYEKCIALYKGAVLLLKRLSEVFLHTEK